MTRRFENEKYIYNRNNIFQRIIVLKTNRYKRAKYQEFFIEGVKNIQAALKFGWEIKYWIYTAQTLSNWSIKMIKEHPAEYNYCFTEELIAEISSKEKPSELMAVLKMKKQKIKPSINPFIIVCDRVSKKGNLGSIIRSADAFGCDGIIITGHSVDIYDPEVIRSSVGSYFAVKVEHIDNNKDLIERFTEWKQLFPEIKFIATDENANQNINEIDFKTPCILLVGNETHGLSNFYLELADTMAKIPMVGNATSFNLACATSIFIYEAFLQRTNLKR